MLRGGKIPKGSDVAIQSQLYGLLVLEISGTRQLQTALFREVALCDKQAN
jgi:hypothetical protein